MSLEEFFKISTSAFANHWFYMNTIYGYELNILETYIELSELSSEEQLYEIVKENLYKFDLDRETFPVDFNFDKSVTLNYENDLFAEYLNDYIVLGHHFIYEDVSYEIIYETEIKELIGDSTYFYDSTGSSVGRTSSIGNSNYYYDSTGSASGRSSTTGSSNYYYDSTGSALGRSSTFGGSTYYYDSTGSSIGRSTSFDW